MPKGTEAKLNIKNLKEVDKGENKGFIDVMAVHQALDGAKKGDAEW